MNRHVSLFRRPLRRVRRIATSRGPATTQQRLLHKHAGAIFSCRPGFSFFMNVQPVPPLWAFGSTEDEHLLHKHGRRADRKRSDARLPRTTVSWIKRGQRALAFSATPLGAELFVPFPLPILSLPKKMMPVPGTNLRFCVGGLLRAWSGRWGGLFPIVPIETMTKSAPNKRWPREGWVGDASVMVYRRKRPGGKMDAHRAPGAVGKRSWTTGRDRCQRALSRPTRGELKRRPTGNLGGAHCP